MEVMEELKSLERDIEKLAKEIGLEEKHVQRFFDGSYSSVSLIRRSKEKKAVLLSHYSYKNEGKVNNPVIKMTNENNHEIVAKMEKFVRLIRFYMSLRKAQEMKEKIKEDLAVSVS